MENYSQSFINAVTNTLIWEGGYANNPSDPGGETNFGISKASFPTLDIATLTREQAIAIYYENYWLPIKGDSMPPQLAYSVFDDAVNQGVGTATKTLQMALGVVPDGIIGPITTAAMENCSVISTLQSFVTKRIIEYTIFGDFSMFGTGWITRTIGTLVNSFPSA